MGISNGGVTHLRGGFAPINGAGVSPLFEAVSPLFMTVPYYYRCFPKRGTVTSEMGVSGPRPGCHPSEKGCYLYKLGSHIKTKLNLSLQYFMVNSSIKKILLHRVAQKKILKISSIFGHPEGRGRATPIFGKN